MWHAVTLRARFRIFTYSYSQIRRFEPTHKEPLSAGEAMRIRLSYTDTHPTPLHARGGRYTRRSGGESAIAAAARSLHPWLCRARSAAASSKQLQPRGEPLVYPASSRAAGWVENRSEVVGRRVRIKGVIGAGVSGSRGERPDTMNVQRVAAAVSRK